MFTPFEGGFSGYSSSWSFHARLNKACLRQPLCSFCCQCYVDIVSHKMRRDTLLLLCCCCGPHTAQSCIHPWHGYVIGKFSSVISSVEREKKKKNQEKVWLRIIRAVRSIFSPVPSYLSELLISYSSGECFCPCGCLWNLFSLKRSGDDLVTLR